MSMTSAEEPAKPLKPAIEQGERSLINSFVLTNLIAPQKLSRHAYKGSITHGAMSEEESQLAAQRRRLVDADYRERCRKKKFIAKFGHRAFKEQYLPLHQIFGDHITGKKFIWEDEKKTKKKMGRKASGAAGGSKPSS
ncbi:hypothetical protein B0H11DRAFT_2239167 [Mycena galericulata]|nr:hypothetical protein B0H11DRAFT_2239167 [Mycena galericulata]